MTPSAVRSVEGAAGRDDANNVRHLPARGGLAGMTARPPQPGSPLPATKVQRPYLRMAQIARPALETRLTNALVQDSLIVVRAPAGYGKTTAVVRALERLPDDCQTFWISADPEDDLPRLLTAIEQSLDRADIPWRISVRGLLELARQAESGLAQIAERVADALDASAVAHGILAIDDFHRLTDAAVFKWLERLIERLPHKWTIALVSREAPALSLPRLRLSGALAEFGPDDLRFTLDEFDGLARLHGMTPPRDELSAIWMRMSGWPAGCELVLQAGLKAAGGLRAEQAAFDYLSNEVLGHLPDDLVTFLMQCSILVELSEPVCAAVTGRDDTHRFLLDIARRGLFVSEIAPGGTVLRLHDLFRDYLQARLQHNAAPNEVATLLVRAANAEPEPERRIGYLVRAARLDLVEEALGVLAGRLLPDGEIERMAQLVHMVPEAQLSGSPDLLYILGICESCYPRWQDADQRMSAAAALFAAHGRVAHAQRAQAYQLVARFGQARTAEAMAMLALLEQEDLDAGAAALCALAGYLLSRVGGTVAQEMVYFDRMLTCLEACDDAVVWNQCGLHVYLGLQQGMARRAERYATGALAVAGDRSEALRDSGLSMRAWHCLLSGDYQQAAAIVSDVESSQAWNSKPYSARGSIQIARSLLVYLSGNAEALRMAASRFYGIFEGREGLSWAYWRGLTAIFFGKLHAALGDWDALQGCCRRLDRELGVLDMAYLRLGRAYLDCLDGLHEARHRFDPGVFVGIETDSMTGDYLALEPELVATRALIRARQHDYAGAWQLLSALVDDMTAAGETIRLLLLGPTRLRELANIPFAGGRRDTQRTVLLAMADRFDATARQMGAQQSPSPLGLSDREYEVLARLAAGDSNKMIAHELNLSPHTIKRHVANILEKLGVTSRGQAAAAYHASLPQ